MPGGNTRTTLHNSPFPLTVVRGLPAVDADGHEYIDVLGEYMPASTAIPSVIRAAIDARSITAGTMAGATPTGQALKMIADRMPSMGWCASPIPAPRATSWRWPARVFAQRKGRQGHQRSWCSGGYHGGVLYFVSGGSGEHPTNSSWRPTTTSTAHALLAKHGELFAVLLEPMQGSHGCLPDLGFLKMVRGKPGRAASHDLRRVMTSALSPGGAREDRRHPT